MWRPALTAWWRGVAGASLGTAQSAKLTHQPRLRVRVRTTRVPHHALCVKAGARARPSLRLVAAATALAAVAAVRAAALPVAAAAVSRRCRASDAGSHVSTEVGGSGSGGGRGEVASLQVEDVLPTASVAEDGSSGDALQPVRHVGPGGVRCVDRPVVARARARAEPVQAMASAGVVAAVGLDDGDGELVSP